jgi:hypothetical protein
LTAKLSLAHDKHSLIWLVAARSTEEFSYFTLRRKGTDTEPPTSLFGIACSRQIDSKALIHKSPDVTRSTVQKAVVVVTDKPRSLGQLREKLSIVTSAWFAQRYVYVPALLQNKPGVEPKKEAAAFRRPG